MLKKIRLLTTCTIIVGLVTGCSSSISKDSIVAEVNGDKITAEYFEKTLKLQKQAVESTYGSEIWDKEIEEGVTYKDNFKDMILEQIIGMKSIYEEAKNKDLLPNEEEIDKRFDLVKGSIDSNEDYKKDLESSGIDDEFIRNQQVIDLAIEKYKENFYEELEISDDEAAEYYNENKDEFYTEQASASHILISTKDDDGNDLSPTDLEDAKIKTEEILEKLKEGEDFETLARENSSCPSSEEGGNLGYFGKGQMVPEFEEAAFSLEKGELSEIVETDFGYHIIKLTDKSGEQRPFEEVRDYIKMQIENTKLEDEIKRIYENSEIKKNEETINKINF